MLGCTAPGDLIMTNTALVFMTLSKGEQGVRQSRKGTSGFARYARSLSCSMMTCTVQDGGYQSGVARFQLIKMKQKV